MSLNLERLDARADASHVVASLEEFGAVIIENLLDAKATAAVNAELDPFIEAADPKRKFLNPALDWFFGDKTRHVSAIMAKSPCFASDVLCHPLLLQVADIVLGPSCASYQLNIAELMDRGPGAEAQMLHRDELVWIHVPRPHPPLQVATMIALEDFRVDNAATQIVPGSHRWPDDRQPKPDEVHYAEMPAGSAALYLGSTLHGGGANTTQHGQRRGIHLSYVVGWLRTEANNTLSCPPDVARKLPRRAQELIGYQAHDAIEVGGGYLGTVDGLDPVDLLAEGKL